MRLTHKLTQLLLALVALAVLGPSALAADPGAPFPATSELSDQKAGSILIYNVYNSNATNPLAENTRINITNTNSTLGAFVHLFFIDGMTCSVADALICLTGNQTVSFLMSDIDPGIMGFLIAVASDPTTGCPVSFNCLIGDEYVRLGSNHTANLGAEAIAAIVPPLCTGLASTVTIAFDGVSYNRLPRVLAADNIASSADGNSTMLVINRIGGSLVTGVDNIGTIVGLAFDDVENGLSFQLPFAGCQFKFVLSDSLPRTTPRLSVLIPTGRTGWMKFWAATDVGILGAQITANTSGTVGAFNGGHNLHKLTLTSAATLELPIFTARCF